MRTRIEFIACILKHAETSGGSINSSKLHEELGWELLRFNPALSLVVGCVNFHGRVK